MALSSTGSGGRRLFSRLKSSCGDNRTPGGEAGGGKPAGDGRFGEEWLRDLEKTGFLSRNRCKGTEGGNQLSNINPNFNFSNKNDNDDKR